MISLFLRRCGIAQPGNTAANDVINDKISVIYAIDSFIVEGRKITYYQCDKSHSMLPQRAIIPVADGELSNRVALNSVSS